MRHATIGPTAVLLCLFIGLAGCGLQDTKIPAPNTSPGGTGSAGSGSGSGDSGAGTSNQPPKIIGTPPTEVTVGQEWNFQPQISDPDGDTLTVSATNLPGWITLNRRSGRMRGTPTVNDIQTWAGIRVTVSDGQSTRSLPAFNVTVLPLNAGTGSATLSWLPPTEQEDGTPLVALAGFRILYGQQSRNYSHQVELNNPGITRYMIEDLAAGTWYFAIQAVGANGLVSAPSAEASKTI